MPLENPFSRFSRTSREPLADKLPNRYLRPLSSSLQHLTSILCTPLSSGFYDCTRPWQFTSTRDNIPESDIMTHVRERLVTQVIGRRYYSFPWNTGSSYLSSPFITRLHPICLHSGLTCSFDGAYCSLCSHSAALRQLLMPP